jgi:V/A-type H+-transporting ATPase subunit K
MEDKVRWTITLTAALVLVVACVLGLGISAAVGATAGEPVEKAAQGPVVRRTPGENIAIASSIAFTTSMACIAAAYAVGKVGAAALGAASERPELLGRSLLFVGLAEGIAIYGLIIAILLWRMLG